jgi:hypothetical protein
MSMELTKQTFTYTPEHLIAGTDIGITTAVKEAAANLDKGAPVILNGSGKAAKVVVDDGAVVTTGLYGIVADSAASGEDVVIYLTGEFFADALALETGVTAADLEVPFRNIGIFLK